MMQQFKPVWDLDAIFEGGSASQQLHKYIEKTEEEIRTLQMMVEAFLPPKQAEPPDSMEEIIHVMQEITKRLGEFGAYVSCLTAQDVSDRKANILMSKRSELGARFENILTQFDQKLVQIKEEVWKALLTSQPFNHVAFVLNERRQLAMDKLDAEKEALINDLAVDGYHGWEQMYDALVGQMSINVNGEELSVGQAANKLSSSDRHVRKEVFNKLQEAWGKKEDLFSETLNHMSGFRLQMYARREWTNLLKEPLEMNRMSEETLTTMWDTIKKYKSHYVKYLERKAKLLDIDQLSFFDVEAPIGSAEETMSYTEGAQFIIDQFRQFSPKMAEFAEMAFEKRWIEAEDRAGKRPGGFCTSFPDSKETRIFMTYSGTPSNVATLAHELGHAYHQHVMNDMAILNQGYAMNVAETASTFAEMIVADAAVEKAKTEEEKLVLLEDKVQRSVAFFMNIHARFLFETKFYEERKSGVLPADRLNELMIEAQKEAYLETLEEYDPSFWASKLHFHITDVPFYNFPYTFGYLFSLGIYAKAKQEGQSFEEDYISLLQDTGRMTVEELAEKHLDVDLTKPDFWEHALELGLKDLEEFMKLSS
ncbi:M3 family oligoendopeptidase [Halobacillus salinarum]|uniref:M3 family oligoendopeptidase n=1 Tax=Halobacillus salinarum TaxID=2932257 RepID=A0ABY4EIC2_9BACI|nr:M3 family oligoendopeptidase [Halobacillus salinarum]UOQ43813.1 M3 family oligoendopeptidase [Halobacillus salinarum]